VQSFGAEFFHAANEITFDNEAKSPLQVRLVRSQLTMYIVHAACLGGKAYAVNHAACI
jgi:hypothetical protein